MIRPLHLIGLAAVIAVVLSGCGGHFKEVRSAFFEQRGEDALALLEDAAADSERDRLLYLMDRGSILNQLGRYAESTQAFLKAADLIDRQDVIRLSRQAAALATNEWATQYKGEFAERLWVHTHLMMNFLLMDRPESALVEARRALKVYDAHETALAGDLVSRSMIALCYDLLGETNDAYIEYKRVADGLGTAAPVARDLARLADLLWEPGQAAIYRAAIPEALSQWPVAPGIAELVLFVSWGRGPEKVARNFVVPPGIRFSFPAYRIDPKPAGEVTVRVNEEPAPVSEVVLNVGPVAAASLDARKGQVLAKEAARVVAKEALVQSLERDDDAALAGALLRVAFVAIEEADTRGWGTLPSTLRLVRVPLPAGESSVVVTVDTGHQQRRIDLGEIRAQGRTHVFRSIRLLK